MKTTLKPNLSRLQAAFKSMEMSEHAQVCESLLDRCGGASSVGFASDELKSSVMSKLRSIPPFLRPGAK